MKPMSSYGSLFQHWDEYMVMAGSAFVGLAIIIFLFYELQVLRQKSYKSKYDYVNTHEIRFFWYSCIALIIAVFFFTNTAFNAQVMKHDSLWFIVRLFVTTCLAIIAYFVLSSLVRIYYPARLEKRLQKIRNKPRVSPEGNLMRKLSESEEDHHLEADQIAEESSNVHSVDYDVWIDDKTGHKIIEKYMAYEHAEECSECGYFTMKILTEEVQKAPTQTENGMLIKHYRCSYCHHREMRDVTLAKLSTNA